MDFTIKKELSQEELFQLLNTFKTDVDNVTDIQSLSIILETYVQTLTPAQHVHLFQINDDKKLLYSVENPSLPAISLSEKKGMVIKCIKDNIPVSANDVKRNSEYNPEVDNIFGYDLKNLLVMPLYDDNRIIFAVLWAGILKNDINQFIHKDIKNINMFVEHIHFSIQNKVETAEEAKDSLLNKNNEISSDDADVPRKTFVSKLKSLFFKK